MKDLKSFFNEDFDDEIIPKEIDYHQLGERVDIATVGDIIMYSNQELYLERKKAITEVFRQILKPNELRTDRIISTRIFKMYITSLMKDYKTNVDENLNLNISSKEELYRILANEFILMILKRPIY